MTIPFTFAGDAVTVFLDGVPHSLDKKHPNFTPVIDLLKGGSEDVAEIERLVSFQAFIQDAVKGQTFGSVTVGQDAVYYNGQIISSYLSTKMLEILALGMDISPWAKFMDKLYRNPSKTAVDELFLWLEKANMPITQGGNFLAYKKVDNNLISYHPNADGSKFAHTLGTKAFMPRNEVDDNRDRTCSTGLHFCSWHYLPQYHGSQGRVMIVEIDPGDVVSIPSDYDNAKGRTAAYIPVGLIDEKQAEFAFQGRPIVDDYNYGEYDGDDDY